MIGAAAYVVAAGDTVCSGAEIGIALLTGFGAAIAPLVYVCTVAAMMLAFAVDGSCLSARWSRYCVPFGCGVPPIWCAEPHHCRKMSGSRCFLKAIKSRHSAGFAVSVFRHCDRDKYTRELYPWRRRRYHDHCWIERNIHAISNVPDASSCCRTGALAVIFLGLQSEFCRDMCAALSGWKGAEASSLGAASRSRLPNAEGVMNADARACHLNSRCRFPRNAGRSFQFGPWHPCKAG